jgi:hypothetical protein
MDHESLSGLRLSSKEPGIAIGASVELTTFGHSKNPLARFDPSKEVAYFRSQRFNHRQNVSWWGEVVGG